MPVFKENIHRNIYIGGLFLLAASLPLSVFGMSLSQLIILGNFLLEGNYRSKFNSVRKRKDLWIFISIYVVHLLWLFPPQDYQYAVNDLRIKIPLLVFPLMLCMEKPLDKKMLRNVLLIFTLSVIVASFISLGIFIKNQTANALNYRELSVFISHIRFSLMVVLSVFILLYYGFLSKDTRFKNWQKVIGLVLMFWLVFFLFILKAQTGLFVFSIIIYFLLWYFSMRIKHWIKYAIVLCLLFLPSIPIIYTYEISKKFIDIETIDLSTADKTTRNGNPYSFSNDNVSVENGYLVWAYYCEQEIQKEWDKKSGLDFYGKDKNNNEIKYTLVRYMTSKGLRKDSLGFSELSSSDIRAIENGVANYIFTNNWKIYPMIYNIIWELYDYKINSYAEGHSVAQRIIYLKTATEIIKENFLLGVGTGNVQKAFDTQYEKQQSKLDPKWRLRAHNQFLTFLITFGVFGFLWIMFAFIYPVIKLKGIKNFLFLVFFFIVSLSFMNEDTLETQAGLTFFVFFYTLLLLAKEKPIVDIEQ